jgi:5-methylcytosine-specific restriction endonuclease McrA
MPRKGKARRKGGKKISLWDLYQREEGVCCKCGTYVPYIEATREHKVPRSHGGRDGKNYSNLGIAHHHCNTCLGAEYVFR